MKRLLLLLVPVALYAGQPRYARLGEFDGKVEVQLHPADAWSPATRNLPLTESAWIRTGPASRLEIELDDGSAWRIGPDSQIEISDYTRLSTGQRVTVLSLDHGIAYFTGEPAGKDTLSLAVPGAQVTLSRGARVRLQADATTSRIAIIEGTVRLFCPAAELDIHEGTAVRVEPAYPSRFGLDREIAPSELDRWNEDRDKALVSSSSGSHVAQRFGLIDLDAAGQWVETDIGAVWKPKVAEGWAPFQKGRWQWYDALGYTWVSGEPWGWLPYHYGRWTRKNDMGWVWSPGTGTVFKPGDVYWLHGAKLAGWGPLSPGEDWQPSVPPQQFLNVNTTYAAFAQDARVIDPDGFKERPKEALGVAVFALALPSPAFPASRLEAQRPMLRVGYTHVNAVIPGTTFQEPIDVPPPPPPPMPPATVENPASDAPPVIGGTPPPPDPGPVPPPLPPPIPVIYPVPVYTGIVVLNPPEHPDYSRRNPNAPPPATTTPTKTRSGNTAATTTTTPLSPPPQPTAPANPPKPGPAPPGQPAPPSTPSSNPPPAAAPPRVNPLPPISRPPMTPSSPPPLQAPKGEAPPVRRDPPGAPKPEGPKLPVPKPDSKPAPKTDDASQPKKQ
jgi:hypothetical protein